MDYGSPDSLYNLLPAVYRIRDAERGYPLRGFLRLIAGQVRIVKEDIDRLWDDMFIETCQDWVVPYIGDLVGNNPLHDIERHNRADVAKTIYYRRRKGTLPLLEELARDVTGWDSHAVEFMQLLAWTQNMNHIRIQSVGCPDLRDLDRMDRVATPFDSAPHSVDVRKIGQGEGWYNIKNTGFFLWRLRSNPIKSVKARRVGDSDADKHKFHFSALGNSAPLFHFPPPEREEAGLAEEVHVGGPIRPAAFYYDLEKVKEGKKAESDYYGEGRSLFIKKDGVGVPPEKIVCMNLEHWARPEADKVGVDVRRGRISLGPDAEPMEVTVTYHYGFSADIGGGEYERGDTLLDARDLWEKTVRKGPADGEVATVKDALVDWEGAGRPRGVIHIADNGVYEEKNLGVVLPGKGLLAIEADNNKRPVLRLDGDFHMGSEHGDSSVVLSGLVIEGGAIRITGELGDLRVLHTTLVPGLSLDADGGPVRPASPSIRAEITNTALEVVIDSSIMGPLRLPHGMRLLTVRDSIIDGLGRAAVARHDAEGRTGPPAVMERTTVLGETRVREMVLANEVIFTGAVTSDHTQDGCVRFSYVPWGSKTPRLYRCQPELAIAALEREPGRPPSAALYVEERARVLARMTPSFTSVRYGQPAYCQLGHGCADEIKTGAEGGSEMGAFQRLGNPQREANLRIRLEEYLPLGLKPGLIYMT